MQWVTLCVWLLSPTVALGFLGRPDFYGPLTASLGEWLMSLTLNLPEHSPPRLSGYFLPHFLGIIAVAVIIAAVALVWSALDRGRTKAHPRLFVWLHTLMRFLLGTTMLWYGCGQDPASAVRDDSRLHGARGGTTQPKGSPVGLYDRIA